MGQGVRLHGQNIVLGCLLALGVTLDPRLLQQGLEFASTVFLGFE